jgi:DNA polymerase III alpha subunit
VAANILDRLRQSAQAASHLAEIFGRENFFIELPADDPDLIAPLAHLARRLRIGTVATNNVHYISPEKAHIHDLLACIGALSTIHDPSPPRHSGGTAYFKSAQEMQARFIAYPEAIAHAVEIADRCGLDLGLGEFHFPHFPLPPGHTADSHLEELCRKGALERYGELPAKVLRRLRHELSVIRRLGFSEYFLVVWDIVRWARSRGIRCSGRGSAGDSLVSYLLGLTSVDPIEADLLFERFLNPERKEMPDVDLDFDSRRRDEVIDYVYQRFGKESVAAVATISTFNARSAIREAGRALGLPAPAVDAVSKAFPHIGADQIREAVSSLPELRGLGLDNRQLEYLFDVCQAIAGFPRHLSVHLGGMVIAPGPLADYLPVEMAAKGVAVAQFDKDDIEALGLVKMDLLGLRNLSAVQETIELLQERGIALDPDKIPLDDPETYRLLRSAQTVGVFQLESPGMRGLLRALQPTRFEDIIANISLFRPGPMQADMIGPFLARRHGKESVSYPHPATARALRSTYGVILYQEQVLEVASAVAGFTLGESDALRRAMTHDRSQEEMEKLRGTFLAGAARKGVDRETAQDVFRSLSAFAAYGFCKAHAACFGHISYQTAYLKAHHPAEFLAAILSNQPMGFYPPEVIVQEAKHLGIPVLPVDVNRSEARYTVEECFQPETTPFTPTLTLSLWDPEGSHRDPEGPHQGGGEAFCIRATVPAPSPQRGRGLGEEGDTQREESAGHPYDSGQQARLHVAPKLYPGASADRSQVLAISARANRTQPGAAVPHKTISAGDGCRAGVPTPATGGPGPFDFAQDRQARPTDGAGRKVLPYAMDVGAERCSARLGSSTAGGGCATWEQQRCSPTERDCRGDRPVAPTQAWRAIRVGLAQVQGISEAAINSILAARKHGPFTSLADFWARANVPRPVAENLIRCGALDSFGPKRALLWHLQALARSNGPGRQMRLFEEENPPLPFRPHTLREEAGLQLSMLGISLKCHPTYFCREQLLRLGVTPSARLSGRPHGSRVKVAGICIARMRPPTKSGQTVIFITLEDETGLSEVTVFERVYQKYGPVIFSNDALLVEGRLQTQGRYGITILAEKIAPLPL